MGLISGRALVHTSFHKKVFRNLEKGMRLIKKGLCF